MREQLYQAYNNMVVVCNAHKCTSEERDELNKNLSQFKELIDEAYPIEESIKT